LLVIVLNGLKVGSVSGQDLIYKLDQTHQFDEKGDAKIEYHFQFGRARWEQWKAQYGDHPDMLLRVINHDMPSAVIEGFVPEKDDTHWRAVYRFTARGMAQYNGNGRFEILLPKSMTWVTGSDWTFTEMSIMPIGAGYGRIDTTDQVKLPVKARNAHLVTGNDYNQLVYSLKVSRSKPKLLLYLGLLLLVAAAVVGVLSFLPSRAKAASSP